MTVSYNSFITRFPEFTDPPFVQTRVEFFLNDVDKNFDEEIWSDWYEEGVCLLVAHELVIDQLNNANPGSTQGLSPVVARAVDDVSVTFAAYLATDPDANRYNYTTYGQKYFELLQSLAIGAVTAW